jgi:hypothetical protein
MSGNMFDSILHGREEKRERNLPRLVFGGALTRPRGGEDRDLSVLSPSRHPSLSRNARFMDSESVDKKSREWHVTCGSVLVRLVGRDKTQVSR